MASSRSTWRRLLDSRRAGRLAAVAALLAGCGTAIERPPARPALPAGESAFLISPLAGYPLTLDPATAGEIEGLHRALRDGGESAATAVELRAAGLLERDPGLHPAAVLRAQARYLGRHYQPAWKLLAPVMAELPSYRAARLLAGRVAERLGDLPAAVEAYQGLPGNRLAEEQAARLLPRAVEIVSRRVDEALTRGHLEAAREALSRLESWAPEENVTLQAAARVAAALDEPEAELAVVRVLAERLPGERWWQERRAELELEVGDPGTGLRALQDLATRNPADAGLADKLARAKFRWRLQLLPGHVQELADGAELSRGDLASLLYWLFPDVRYGRVAEARIANDIFDHPRREEIMRVVNLGLMEVDPDLHRFEPYRPVRRLEVLSAALRVLDRAQPPQSCLGEVAAGRPVSVSAICLATTRCGLIGEEADCLPYAPVSGAQALDISRRALDLLGVQ